MGTDNFSLSLEQDSSIKQLLRAIKLSAGEFALLLAQCNSEDLRDRLLQVLQSHLGSGLYMWQATPELGAVNLVEVLEDAPEGTQVACVTGLEPSPHLNDILAIANNAREEFRKRLAFPVIIWVTDDSEIELRRRAPDFTSWAAPPIVFQLEPAERQEILERKTAAVIDWAFSREGRHGTGAELKRIWQKLDGSGTEIAPDLAARVALVFGIEGGSDPSAREALERCLALAHEGPLAAAACYRLGLWWERQGKRNRAEFVSCCKQALAMLQRAWHYETGRRPNVALALGGVLLALALQEPEDSQPWAAVADFADSLSFLSEFAGGLRAEVALARGEPATAQQEAEQALQGNEPERAGFYRLALGRSLIDSDQAPEAVTSLEQAREAVPPEADPDLHIRILRALHRAYTLTGNYRQAFAAKCDREAVETQYGFRAFIGAGRLRPLRQVGALGEVVTEEIAASGRQADIEALVARVKRNDCRLTVIHGPSGVGKSSLIQAGLVPALRRLMHQSRSVVPIAIERYDNWQGELAQQLQGGSSPAPLQPGSETYQIGEPEQSGVSSTQLIAFLRENYRRHLITVLIFDQFEEFFFQHLDLPGRREFYGFLRDCLDVSYVWVFLSLREDYIHYLLEWDRLANLTAIGNDILNKNVRYYLGNFSAERAKGVIGELMGKSPYRFEVALVDRLVADLAAALGEGAPH
ncbi:ATP-binding protein [Acaryochloris sp. IP29b_bin.137]|uniref:nSTAND1 domain-containing NTPase n=1 Tax=Acaryochloris sp. IP29b_bin.137 TaxID=2969217 RepID=UPI0026185CEC|nr:ATP-binding protein [Acaryochloris sp. IP29b_bin.137]